MALHIHNPLTFSMSHKSPSPKKQKCPLAMARPQVKARHTAPGTLLTRAPPRTPNTVSAQDPNFLTVPDRRAPTESSPPPAVQVQQSTTETSANTRTTPARSLSSPSSTAHTDDPHESEDEVSKKKVKKEGIRAKVKRSFSSSLVGSLMSRHSHTYAVTQPQAQRQRRPSTPLASSSRRSSGSSGSPLHSSPSSSPPRVSTSSRRTSSSTWLSKKKKEEYPPCKPTCHCHAASPSEKSPASSSSRSSGEVKFPGIWCKQRGLMREQYTAKGFPVESGRMWNEELEGCWAMGRATWLMGLQERRHGSPVSEAETGVREQEGDEVGECEHEGPGKEVGVKLKRAVTLPIERGESATAEWRNSV
ncbi:hypothetical protein BU23DRAFT_230479 [Bimuria novae-zelandiae CBS 107.79]|uniref:Uncharacterized protein n=1 Tax=Bimuria novae-zelandiae CBS 107.79 TaxID=1447943 RepID=A0A6A5VQ34_9PLEO|nr:hypothetical protein BU23DRAFT_230479 [Bimuria novae-zelandiae CBS 107.79]